MSKASTLALVQTFCGNAADVALIDGYYTDIVRDLGIKQWLTTATLVPASSGTNEYTLPSTCLAVIDAIYSDAVLDFVSLGELESVNSGWRAATGTPIAFTTEDEPAQTLRLYPTPTSTSGPFIFSHGAPFGLDYPANTICFIHTELRVDVPVWLELPIALRICQIEFVRESNHRDPVFARYCGRLADMLFAMVT